MVEGIQYKGGISSIRWKIISTDVSHHQYEGGASSVQWMACRVWTCHIINTEPEGVQYMATKTAQGVVAGCIYVGKRYFTDNIAQISSYCDDSRCP